MSFTISSNSKNIFLWFYLRPKHISKFWYWNTPTTWNFLCHGLRLNGSNLVQCLLSYMPNKSNSPVWYNNDVRHLYSMLCQNLSIPTSRYNGQCFFHICNTRRTDIFWGGYTPPQHVVCICFLPCLLCFNVHLCLVWCLLQWNWKNRLNHCCFTDQRYYSKVFYVTRQMINNDIK